MVGPEKSDQKWPKSEPKSRISGIGVTLVGFFKNSEAVNIKGPSCPTVGRLLDAFSVISQLWGHFSQLSVTFHRLGSFLNHLIRFESV